MMKKILFLTTILLIFTNLVFADIDVTGKFAPKNNGFIGLIDAEQVLSSTNTVGQILISNLTDGTTSFQAHTMSGDATINVDGVITVTGGGGGSSTLQVKNNDVEVTSPTVSIDFQYGLQAYVVDGSTVGVTIDTDTLQTNDFIRHAGTSSSLLTIPIYSNTEQSELTTTAITITDGLSITSSLGTFTAYDFVGQQIDVSTITTTTNDVILISSHTAFGESGSGVDFHAYTDNSDESLFWNADGVQKLTIVSSNTTAFRADVTAFGGAGAIFGLQLSGSSSGQKTGIPLSCSNTANGQSPTAAGQFSTAVGADSTADHHVLRVNATNANTTDLVSGLGSSTLIATGGGPIAFIDTTGASMLASGSTGYWIHLEASDAGSDYAWGIYADTNDPHFFEQPIYLGQPDGAEKISSSSDGQADLEAGTKIAFNIDSVEKGSFTASGFHTGTISWADGTVQVSSPVAETSHATVVTAASTLTDTYIVTGSGNRGVESALLYIDAGERIQNGRGMQYGSTNKVELELDNASGAGLTATAGNTIVKISGSGTGAVQIGQAFLQFPDVDGSAGQFLKTDGSTNLSWDNGGGTISTHTFNVLIDTATTTYLGSISIPTKSFGADITISSITFTCDAGTVTGVDVEWVSDATPFASGTDVLTGTIDVGTGARYGASGFADATIGADNVLRITSTGTTGTPTALWARIEYTFD